MGEKISRRDALARLGGGAVALGVAAMSGIERVAFAASAQMDGHLRAQTVVISCPVPNMNYGCRGGYCEQSGNECINYDYDCQNGNGFAGCPQWAEVYCEGQSDEDHGFKCLGEVNAYGCTHRIFTCGKVDAGWFICGDNVSRGGPSDYVFNCRPGKFNCDPIVGFHCKPDTEFCPDYPCQS